MRLRRVAEDTVDARVLREGIAAIQTEQQVSPVFPREVGAGGRGGRLVASAAGPGPDRHPARYDRPRGVDGPRPGAPPRTRRGRLSRALRHRRRGRVRRGGRPGRPRGASAGQTFYGADSKIPLHPKVLSEGAASLLPDVVRPALLWTIRVDAGGEGTDIHVERARVRSRAKLDYAGVQRLIDDGGADESLRLLRELGEKRLAREAARGGIDLPMPEQEIDIDGQEWRLEFRNLLPVERWNAQISLLCGFGAAALMVYARVGLLRTLPPPDPRDVKRLHRTARALGIGWPAELLYPDFIRSLDPRQPAHAAMVVACTRLLRGAATSPSTARSPPIRSTRRSRRSTPT